MTSRRVRLLTLAAALGFGLAPWAPRPSEGKPAFYVPALEGRLWLGHDSNLLDASDVERESFASGDPGAFFAVDRMSDQFGQGEIGIEWKAGELLGRPSLRLEWQRRQYLRNPIKSEDDLRLGLGMRPGERTRVDVRASLRPQVYGRHRYHQDALPGEPQFRPEVHRRWDLDFRARYDLTSRAAADVLLEGSRRRYRAPFEERDRESFGGGGGFTLSLGGKIEARAGVRHRATWTRNEPWDPDDRSYRAWRTTSGVAFGRLPFFKSVSLDLDLEWRRFTSTNPDDQDHFGRRDRGGEAELDLVRRLAGSLDWASRATWRWRTSNFPQAVFDEEGDFDETVIRTGVMWSWEPS